MSDDFKKIPGAQLAVCPEWAEAMGYDPAELEAARVIAEGCTHAALTTGVATFTIDPDTTVHYSTREPGMPEDTPEARGYVVGIDHDAGGFTVAQHERSLETSPTLRRFVPPEQEPESWLGIQFSHLVYVCCVLRGAQPTVDECWPRYRPLGRQGGKSMWGKSMLESVAQHYYASTPPKATR